MRLKLVLAALFLGGAALAHFQTVPDAIAGHSRLCVGAGVSGYNDGYNSPGSARYAPGVMEGAALWFEVYLNRGPAFLQGLGIEAEARDIEFGRPGDQPSNLREDTAGGGAIYSWRHYRHITPYGKFLYEHGSIDFRGVPGYNHDDRDLRAFGGGIEYRVRGNLSVRGDYEHQSWERIFENHMITPSTWLALKPRGVTIGVSYSVRFHPGR